VEYSHKIVACLRYDDVTLVALTAGDQIVQREHWWKADGGPEVDERDEMSWNLR
jgi:hypothetical protein